MTKTLVILYPGCIEFEVMLACEILNRVYPVEVITPDGQDHVASNGMTIKAAGALHSVNPNDYRVVLIPGGDPRSVIDNEALSEVLRACANNQAILAAICAGPIILDQAGLLKGQRIAHGYGEAQRQFLSEQGYFKDVVLTDEPLISNGQIVTAKPSSFIDFAIEVARLVGVTPESEVEFFRQYYRGRPFNG